MFLLLLEDSWQVLVDANKQTNKQSERWVQLLLLLLRLPAFTRSVAWCGAIRMRVHSQRQARLTGGSRFVVVLFNILIGRWFRVTVSELKSVFVCLLGFDNQQNKQRTTVKQQKRKSRSQAINEPEWNGTERMGHFASDRDGDSVSGEWKSTKTRGREQMQNQTPLSCRQFLRAIFDGPSLLTIRSTGCYYWSGFYYRRFFHRYLLYFEVRTSWYHGQIYRDQWSYP